MTTLDTDFDEQANKIDELVSCPKCGKPLEPTKEKGYIYECSNPYCDYKAKQSTSCVGGPIFLDIMLKFFENWLEKSQNKSPNTVYQYSKAVEFVFTSSDNPFSAIKDFKKLKNDDVLLINNIAKVKDFGIRNSAIKKFVDFLIERQRKISQERKRDLESFKK